MNGAAQAKLGACNVAAFAELIPLLAAAVSTAGTAVISNQQNKAAQGKQNKYLAAQKAMGDQNRAEAEAARKAAEDQAAAEQEGSKTSDLASQIAAAKARAAGGVGNAGVSPDFYTAMFSSQGYGDENTTGAGGAP